MKTFRLCVHTEKTHKNQDILLCTKDFPDVKAGDVVELYHPEDEWNRLLLQVKCLPEDFTHRESVSIEQGISTSFSLRPYNKIVVNKVEPKKVRLDLVELLFKEQYFGRSDMWRLMKTLNNTCVYLKKQIEFAEMRATVYELWSQGENVTSGLITEDTRVVFRSPTAVVQIFIQISSEMWDFDLHGDLYFEKAVNGFLTDLFARWKDQKCLHDVTIVMFSRTFYEAKSIEDFPPAVRDCLQKDCRDRIYEDFYRVVIQNERYEEWTGVLRELRTIFNSYEDILNFHLRPHHRHQDMEGWKMPKGHISTAAQGNFLETLNMSLNLFEKYYLDRNFDRTGKVSVVITPGPGVFEVDRQLANITKQRTIDCGVGSDLVCMGEQPLHAAPLFKFHSKSSNTTIEVGDDYSIPHWMNHSFYMSKNQIQNHMNSPFVPRIKPPPALMKELEEGNKEVERKKAPGILHRTDDPHETNIPFVDYDEYDAQVFKLPSGTMPRSISARSPSLQLSSFRGVAHPKTFAEARSRLVPRTRHTSDDVCVYPGNERRDSGKGSSAAITIPSHTGSIDDSTSASLGCYPIQERALSRDSFESSESDELIQQRCVVGSAGSPVSHSRSLLNYRPRRALINPFAPSRLQFKMTSNRRRWVHAFPVDKSGKAMQQRHVHSVQHSGHENDFPWSIKESVQSPSLVTIVTGSSKKNRGYFDKHDSDNDLVSQGGESMSGSPLSRVDVSSTNFKRNLFDNQSRQMKTGKRQNRNMFSLTGTRPATMFGSAKSGSEQDWSPDMNTAVDWKSLTIPASLPLTTDYFPDRHSLQYDYVVNEYQIIVEETFSRPSSCDEKTHLVYHRPPLTTQQVFLELISQRLGQGFQLITKKSAKKTEGKPDQAKAFQSSTGLFSRLMKEPDNECYLNIGRIYHKLTSVGRTIKVTNWRPSHPNPQFPCEYQYRFQAPDSNTYDVSSTSFSNELLENYNWNHLDDLFCSQGDYWQCSLIDSLKYWRSRFFLLPLDNPATKKIIAKETTRCDIYEERSLAYCQQLTSRFIKFLETLNKLKRTKGRQEGSRDATRDAGPSASAAGSSSGESSPRKLEGDGSKEKEEKLSVSSPSLKIVEALLCPNTGLQLMHSQSGLPTNSFISCEAVAWCRKNLEDVDTTATAITLMQRLMDEHLVFHCSGNPQHRFIFGFYLYYVPQKVLGKPEASSDHPSSHYVSPGANFNLLFQNEWCEVTVLPLREENRLQQQPKDQHNLLLQQQQQQQQQKHVEDTTVPNELTPASVADVEEETTPKGGSPTSVSPPALPTDHQQHAGKGQGSLTLGTHDGGSSSSSQPEKENLEKKLQQGLGGKPRFPLVVGRKRSDSELVPEVDDWRLVTGFREQDGVKDQDQPPATLLHKYVNVEVDPAKKSDRREFAIARYQAYYSPGCAFELQLQWMVATGCILGELVYAYARKAQLYGFHLLPVPCDPFALPYNNMSDPLRGPVFVPLDMEAFPEDLFQDCSFERRQQILYVIQDAIVKRFGFMPCCVKVPEQAGTAEGGGGGGGGKYSRDPARPILFSSTSTVGFNTSVATSSSSSVTTTTTAPPPPSQHGSYRPRGYGFSYSCSSSVHSGGGGGGGEGEASEENYNHQYVHCTGGMFILIPESDPQTSTEEQTSPLLKPPSTSTMATSPRSLSRLSQPRIGTGTSPYSPSRLTGLLSSSLGGRPVSSSFNADSMSTTSTETEGSEPEDQPHPLDPFSKRSASVDLHKLYIARQAGRLEVGFLWAWNYVLSKKWRSSNTGDENFQDAMLADFRKFCSNEGGRLKAFWGSFKATGALERIA